MKTDEIREQLSALVDEELSDIEQPLLLGRLERDPELRDCLARYELIGAVLRGEGKASTLGVAGRVQAALHDDAPLRGTGIAVRRTMRWWKPVAGLAVAASVALVALLSVTTLRETSTEPAPLVAQGDAAPAVTVAADEQWDRIEPRIDKRLSGYLVNHNEYAASRGVQGVMPYVRIVGFDNDQQ